MAIAAHPGSPKPELRWTDWDVPIDGLEWLNADSEWRDEPLRALARALLTYPFRRPETLATLLDRRQESLQRWDELTAQRPRRRRGGADAHARIRLTQRRRAVRQPHLAAASGLRADLPHVLDRAART